MLNEDGGPVQVLAEAVAVIVAEIGLAVVFVALKTGIFPEPLPVKPMAVLLLVQVKLAPAVGLVNEEAVTAAPLHTVISVGTVTVGEGFTVIE